MPITDTYAANISDLAQLLSGYTAQQPQKPSPWAAPRPTQQKMAPPILAPSTPQPGFSVSALPNTAASPILSPNLAPKKSTLATELTPQSVTMSAAGQRYSNQVAANQRGMYQSKVEEYAQPLNPDEYKPRWWQRIGAAMATFGAAYQHNPNAIEIGTNLLNANFNRAEYRRQAGLKGAQQSLEDFDKGERLRNEQTDQNIRWLEFDMRRDAASHLAAERDARAAKYENVIDPNSIQQDEKDGKWYGTTYGGQRVEAKPPESKRKSLADIMAQRSAEIEIMKKSGIKFTPDEEKYYRVNGKLREPNPDAEARLAEARANRADREDAAKERNRNNAFMRYQTQLSVYNARKAAIDDKARRAWDSLQRDFEGEYYGDGKREGVSAKADSDANKKAVLDKYQGRKLKLQSDLDAQYRDLGAAPQQPPILNDAPRAATNKPLTSSGSAAPKVATMDQVKAFAQSKGMKVEDVVRQLKSQNYTIR